MKKFIQLVILLWITHNAIAQTFNAPVFAEVNNNHRTYVNNVFGSLEANRIATGLLVDYGFDFTDPRIYNGTILADSTLMEQGIYSELYKTIFTSKFNNNAGTLRHPYIHDSLCYIARKKEVITLSGLLFKYNAIDPNAQSNGKIQVVNGQLKDKYVNGVWQNPYQELNTFAISPSTIKYNLTNCSVILPSNLFLTNRGTEISTIQFDAADGSGYRTIQYDTPINLNYTSTGWKHWVFKITLTSGQQLFSHSKIYFDNISNIAGNNNINITARGAIDYSTTIVATEAFNGVLGVADLIISYHDPNDKVLRKPLIVAEGFDPGWITSPEEPEGENTFVGFMRNIRFGGSSQLVSLIGDIGNPNTVSQYDVVYVNWRNGTDYLQRNELVLEAVIRWVNAHKQPDLVTGLENPNVVLGISMGGVIARMALGRMDRGGGQNGSGGYTAHKTGLYVSLDAPHQGANVPLGYQAAARHAARMYISSGMVALTVETIQLILNGPSPLLSLLLADQPASKQLLKNRIDIFYNISNSTNQQFLQELRTQWAYPVNIRNVAISNGSECAIDQEFAPGSSLLYHYRSTKTRFIGDLLFMLAGAGLQAINVSPIVTIPLTIPGSNKFELTIDIKSTANGGGNAVYYGNIKLTKKVLWLVPVSINIANDTYYAPSGSLPLDTYPGGFYGLSLDSQPGSVSQDWMFSYNNSFYIQRRFSFVPTTSSLDIGLGNTTLTQANYLAKYIGATPPIAPLNTPFANFTTAFNQDKSQYLFDNDNLRLLNNEPHTDFYVRTANWLATEMSGITTGRTNCSAFCTNASISGPSIVCNSETFTAPFGSNVTYQWTVNNPGLVTLYPNGNSVVVTRNGTANGEVILSVNINGACGNTSLSTPLVIGQQAPTSIDYTFDSCNEVRVSTNYFTNTTYTWYYFKQPYSGNVTQFSNSSSTRKLTLAQGSGTYNIGVDITNACGKGNIYFISVPVDCGSGNEHKFMVSPNPSSNTLQIMPVNSFEKTDGEEIEHNEIHEIEISDKMGLVRYNQKLEKGLTTTNINVYNLPAGIYTLRIFNGVMWDVLKINIQH